MIERTSIGGTGLSMLLSSSSVLRNSGFPWWLKGKESAFQRRRCRRHRFSPWVEKIPWRREWLATPVFLPGEVHGQRSLVDYSPWGGKELDTTEQLTLLVIQDTCGGPQLSPSSLHTPLHFPNNSLCHLNIVF